MPNHSCPDVFAFPNGLVALDNHHALRRKPDVRIREHERNPHIAKSDYPNRLPTHWAEVHAGFAADQLQMSEDEQYCPCRCGDARDIAP
ncbi:MAG TPA: hypothetical protein VJP60_06030 [Rhizomicrobium sp.]|nr:hypothetical protein [Rhizomicrobium sp.]